jgi:hypothetical protein
VLDPHRRFGMHVPGWLDERPYAFIHDPPVEMETMVPAGGTLDIPLALDPTVRSVSLAFAWSGVPGLADLDVRLVDEDGAEVARSTTLNGHGLFGRTESIRLDGLLPATLTAQLFFKAGTGVFDQPVAVRSETARAVITAWDDLDALTPDERTAVVVAASRNLIGGRALGFAPSAALTRGELARSLAWTSGVAQRIPGSRSFDDVGPAHVDLPWIESVAGRRAERLLVEPWSSTEFRASARVRRIDFAAALVRAAGLGDEADALAGTAVGLADDAAIPARLRGHAQLALAHGFIEPIAGRFEPTNGVPRVEAARRLIALSERLRQDATAVTPAAVPGVSGMRRPKVAGRPPSRIRADLRVPQPSP